ncbi:ATP-binding cassette domain-containing protein, partial [Roseovarius sp.]|uniref:ATP-binding cassette domain-containing protein n=1 Tax=Roseovarius sp. TaxID=1486281 RepID=UPI00356B50D0
MTRPLLEVRNLYKSFGGNGGVFRAGRRAQVVNDVSFRIARGETYGLVGESGSGKSTIGRTVLRLLEPDRGEVRFDGQEVTALSRADLQRLRRR